MSHLLCPPVQAAGHPVAMCLPWSCHPSSPIPTRTSRSLWLALSQYLAHASTGYTARGPPARSCCHPHLSGGAPAPSAGPADTCAAYALTYHRKPCHHVGPVRVVRIQCTRHTLRDTMRQRPPHVEPGSRRRRRPSTLTLLLHPLEVCIGNIDHEDARTVREWGRSLIGIDHEGLGTLGQLALKLLALHEAWPALLRAVSE